MKSSTVDGVSRSDETKTEKKIVDVEYKREKKEADRSSYLALDVLANCKTQGFKAPVVILHVSPSTSLWTAMTAMTLLSMMDTH